ncbi:D-aminoacyl-tRNA deacylase [Methylomagnum ishizawai]|uniref:D-aminoacyl-tRNA deacylase n=1 Tax=Methylomagnum ishizawai TaxID=1760988 RepID=UPI001C336AA5|nr:D-aminoacyl-tRNA deacylase [Methylomagnum ishizawai]BBL74580.1 D-aminoacyl-tRNA deacylase [Methylomagnum ishizawai]
MLAVVQRVARAEVRVDGESVGRIGPGLLALVAVERGDTEAQAERLAGRLLGYRMFADAGDKMNLSVMDTGGGVLLVSQFTLAADTRKGMRPSFTPAADPETGRRLFDELVARVRARHGPVETGRFGANMQVELVNDGPVTFSLRVAPPEAEP